METPHYKEEFHLMTSNFDQWIQDLADAEYKQRPHDKLAYATKTVFHALEQLIAAG
jgi:hypothetical protein